MKIVINKRFVPKGYAGISLFPFVVLAKAEYKENKVLINHEAIHIQQQKELLVLPFFIWYGLNYLYNLFKYKNHREAYHNIIFEREAYGNQYDLEYLKNRKRYAFKKYLKRF